MTLNVIYRSESGSSIEETNMIPGGTGAGSSMSSGHRKLSAAMSMPVYPSYAAPIYFNPINKHKLTSYNPIDMAEVAILSSPYPIWPRSPTSP